MNTKSDNLWMAYLDGELTAAEISEFEEQASPDDIKRLGKEKKFETELKRNLSDVKCPDEVWNNVITDIKQMERKRSGFIKFISVAGIAAVIALSSGIIYRQLNLNSYPVLKQVTTLAALNSEVEISGETPSRVQSLLKTYGFDLELAPIPEKGHKIKLLGAYTSECCCGGKVVALCFDCCGKPVRLVVMKGGTDFVKNCECKCEEGAIQKMVKKGPYMVAAIGNHPADELLGLLEATEAAKTVETGYDYSKYSVSKLY